MEETEEKVSAKKAGKPEASPAAYAVKSVIISMILVVVVSNIVTLLLGFAAMAAQLPLTRERFTYFAMPGKVITLILFWFKYRKRLTGFFDAKGLGAGLLLGWGMLAVNAFTLISGLIDHQAWGNFFIAVWNGIQPGFSEEIWYRIIPISLAMKTSKREQAAVPAMMVTSIIFGLFHGFNIFYGADVVATLLQVSYAFAIGLALSGIYLKTGNMWIPIILHSITDIIYFMSAEGQSSGGVLSQQMGLMEIAMLLGYIVVYFANAYYVHKKTRTGEIVETWTRIWDSKQVF